MFKRFLTMIAAFALTIAGYAAAVELREDHPDTYVVQEGDTLWDIARRFLAEPWLWPEIWQANPQIENPHLIFPGDVISLAYLAGKPSLQITKLSPQVRRTPINAVPTIPLADIEGFLSKAHVLSKDEYKRLPYVIGVEEDQLRSASGELIYVRGAEIKAGSEWAVLRPTVRYAVHPHPVTEFPRLKRDEFDRERGLQPLPVGIQWAYYAASDDGFEVLGYELVEVASGQATRGGDPATILLAAEGREVRKGDLLMPLDKEPFDLTFHPHRPKSIPDQLRILALTDRIRYAGPNDVMALSAGARDGIDNGTVFSIYRPGERVRDHTEHRQPIAASLPWNKVALPDEFVGHVMVFRTFEKVSYGLIVNGIRPAKLEDRLKAPERL